MPIYEYECKDCEKVFEIIRPMSQSDATVTCAICGGTHTQRKLSIFFAESGGKAVSGTASSGCGNCGGGSCSNCGH